MLSAVLVMEAVILKCVQSKMQVHVAGSICPLQRSIFPAIKREIFFLQGRLYLHNSGKVLQGNVNVVAHGVLTHTLGQTAYISRNADAVVLCACIRVYSIGAYYHGNNCGVNFITGRRCCLLQEITGVAAVGPFHFGLASFTAITCRGENQHSVFIGLTRRDLSGTVLTIVIAIQGKPCILQGVSILVNLLHIQFPALVGNINQRAEIPIELFYAEKTEFVSCNFVKESIHVFPDLLINFVLRHSLCYAFPELCS